MVVRRHLVFVGFNSSKIGHDSVSWQKQPNILLFKATDQFSKWPEQLISLTAALPLCCVTICTAPPPLCLHLYIIISPVRHCCVLSCRVQSRACTASLCRAQWFCSGGSCQLLQQQGIVCLIWFSGLKVSCPLLTLFLHVWLFQFFFFLRSTVLTSWTSRKHPQIRCMDYFTVLVVVLTRCSLTNWAYILVSVVLFPSLCFLRFSFTVKKEEKEYNLSFYYIVDCFDSYMFPVSVEL